MRRGGAVGAVLVALVLVAGCSDNGGGAGAPAALSTAPPGSDEPGGFAERLTMSGTVGDAVSTTVTVDGGGTLAYTAPDGTAYTLTVPPSAVDADVEVSAVYLGDIRGVRAAQHAQGLQFAPDGLQFALPATLTVTPVGVAEGHLLAFDATSTGEQPGAAIVVSMSTSVEVMVSHFSIVGIADLLKPLSDWVKDSIARPGDPLTAERDLARELGEWMQQSWTDQGANPADAIRLFNDYYTKVVEPAITAGTADCAGANRALGVQARYAQWTNGAWRGSPPVDKITVMSPATLQVAFDAVMRLCEPVVIRQCRAENDDKVLTKFWNLMKVRRSKLGVPPDPGDAQRTPAKAKTICIKERWSIEGSADEATFSGTIESGLDQPFTIQIEFPGGSGSAAATPASRTSGTVVVTGSGSMATLGGSGTYTISGAETGTALMVLRLNVCVDVSSQCRSSTVNLTLRKLDD